MAVLKVRDWGDTPRVSRENTFLSFTGDAMLT